MFDLVFREKERVHNTRKGLLTEKNIPTEDGLQKTIFNQRKRNKNILKSNFPRKKNFPGYFLRKNETYKIFCGQLSENGEKKDFQAIFWEKTKKTNVFEQILFRENEKKICVQFFSRKLKKKNFLGNFSRKNKNTNFFGQLFFREKEIKFFCEQFS